ncbi:MAG: alcohol dehydrogenase catalytic domain-containing protein [Thermoflexales bacterium]|nr:alcohol dehydrogenase catalytic domain-containing protein [Thermoflexales bacterium]
MKALVKPYGPPGLKLVERPIPAIGDEDVLVRVLAASVCGTDLHIYHSSPSMRDRVAHEQTIGHEFCGEVVATGPQVTRVTAGDLVSGESHIVCGTCEYCLDGMSHLCQEVTLVGVERPGGFAQYVALPEQNVILKSPKISLEVASFLDAYGNAVDTALCVPLIGKTVLVTGCGPQGMMAIAIALAAGARQVIATELHAKRRECARELIRLHANPNQARNDLVLDGASPSLVDEIYKATDGLGVDVLLEMSGHPTAIRDGCTLLRNAGHAVVLGLGANQVELNWTNLMFKGATIHFRYGRHLYRTWSEGRRLLESGLVKLDSLVYGRDFALDEFEEAFRLLDQGEAVKVIFRPNPA